VLVKLLTCKTCAEEKPEDQFNRDRSKKIGRRGHCKVCENKKIRSRRAEDPEEIKQARRDQSKKFRQEQPEKARAIQRNSYLKWQYGMTSAEYDVKLASQGGGCYICEKTPQEEGQMLAVDHDHGTGKIRGILCQRCNTTLGRFQEDPKLLRKVANYIEEWS
jgi:hypothetical protein